MNKNSIILICIVAIVFVLNFGVKPVVQKNYTKKLLITILTHFQDGDAPTAITYWYNEKEAPPIYELRSYDIRSHKYDKIDGRYEAEFIVNLVFSSATVLPSDKEYVIKLAKTEFGWKVISFKIVGNQEF